MRQLTKMASFEYTKLTLAGDKEDDDEKRVKVFGLNPFSMESFGAYNMLELWFESEVVG